MTARICRLAASLLVFAASPMLLSADEPKAKPEVKPEVKLEGLSFDAFKSRMAENPTKAKYTLVDAWATFCPPCKENFSHLVDMDRKYKAKGLAVVSVSLDNPKSQKALKEALAFLKDKEKDSPFANYYITGDEAAGFDGFDISAIPAVFLYGPDGKEIRRFTLEDVDNQFTYEDVEKAVKAVLDGKPLPEDNAKSKPKK